MRTKTCCFTGHRKIPFGQYEHVSERLREEIISLIHDGITFFGAGGALGFDTLAALTVLSLKKEYPQIKLILVLPCLNQTKGWEEKDVKVYKDIKAQCDKYIYTSQEYTRCCMSKRNRYLADNSSICVCYLTRKTGGTAYAVDYARKKGLNVISLA